MRVGIIGSGYVGLVTGATLADRGHEVVCVDTDPSRIEAIRSGRAPFFEPGLNELLARLVKNGLLAASDRIEHIADCETALLAVGTPSQANGRLDTSYLESAALALGRILRARPAPGALGSLFVKSTVLPGTTRNVVMARLRESGGPAADRILIGMMPEFLREGSAVADALFPDRIVVGADRPELIAVARALFCAPSDPEPIETSIETAELIKYTNNALLSLCISFSNEIARIAEATPGVDAEQVFRGVTLDRRWIGNDALPGIVAYLKPGCGFGGSCFPKDVRALSAFAADLGIRPKVVPSILEVNGGQPAHFVDLVSRTAGHLAGKNALVLGLSFKPETDDVRESPAFGVVAELERSGARVAVHDPAALDNFRACLSGGAIAAQDWRAAAREADIVLVVTGWKEYLEDLPAIVEQRQTEVVIGDGRGFFRARKWPASVKYCVIGRAPPGLSRR